jgi:UDP-GlcNAc:undecaprenyl-phosphate GlcNAc-1-phosphate transferase
MTFNFFITFILSLILLGLFVRFAGQFGFSDTPDFRSSHKKVTPSSSGIAFFVAVFIAAFFTDFNIYQNYRLSILGALLVFLLGVFDDLKNYRARYKLYIITVAAILSCVDGFVIKDIGTYFGYTIPLLTISIPFTIFAVVAFTNALNLIDGLDGLVGTISIIILSSLWFIGYQNNDYLLMGVTALIIPALLAFLVFNWNPARVFMGDSGSLTLGFIISILSIKALDYASPAVILYLVTFPLFDTLIIMIRRRMYGRSIFHPDQNHAHHVFLNTFNGEVKITVVLIALIQLVYVLAGITLVRALPQEITLPFLVLNIIIWYFVLTRLCKNHSKLLKERNLKISHDETEIRRVCSSLNNEKM